jgi:hypothetical protein
MKDTVNNNNNNYLIPLASVAISVLSVFEEEQ